MAVRRYFLWRLVAVAGFGLLPLMGLHAFTLYREYSTARAAAIKTVQGQSADTRRELDAMFGRAETLLRYLASREELQHFDTNECSRLLKGLVAVDPVYMNIGAIGLDGRGLCLSDERNRAPTVSYADNPWFLQVKDAESAVLVGPVPGRVAPRPVAILVVPVRDARGRRVALVGVTLELAKLAEALQAPGLPSGSSVTLVTAGNRVLARVPDFDRWVGRAAPVNLENRQRMVSEGFAIGKGMDGVERMFAVGEIPRYHLRVIAGVPTDVVLAPVIHESVRDAAIAVLLIVAGAVLAGRWASGLTQPLRLLRLATREVASGRTDVRVKEDLPGEFRELAKDFNHMTEALADVSARLQESTDHSLRLARLYEALSSTNQAITRPKPRDVLLQDICNICVTTGHATMAWIGMMEGRGIVTVAAAGRAREYLQVADLSFDTEDPGSGGPTGQALRTGAPYIANDFSEDPLTRPWRHHAVEFGIRACAAIPFRRGSQVVGVLKVYVDEAGFFDDQVVKLLLEIAGDISYALETAESEKTRVAMQRALERRELQLAGVVETARDAIVSTDERHRILSFNKAASAMFGVSHEEALGQELSRFIPPSAQPGQADYAAYLATGNAEAQASTIALTGLRRDGSRIPLEVSFTEFGEPGKLLRTLVMRDASLVQEAERAHAAQADAEAANWAKTNFLSRMSHELRTPLNAVIGFSQLLQDSAGPRLNEPELRQLELIHLAGEQLRALVEDVLDVSRVEAGQVLVSLQDIELCELLDGAVTFSYAAAQSSDVRLVAEYRKQRPMPLRTDPVRLRQVMLNLISNGIKYNKHGGTVTVTVDAVAAEGYLEIGVQDTGLGMTAEQLRGLFQPFNRLGRETTTIVGTGLGMALTRQLVELMGGSIHVDSTPGSGTFAKVRLPFVEPVTRPESGSAMQTGVVQPRPADEPDEPEGVVLYVEDNPVNVLLVRQILGIWSRVQVLVAEDGASGLRLLESLRPNVVLLDMHLPDMSGLDVLRALGSSGDLAYPVIALSASAMTQEVAAAKSAGASDYWTKPVDVEVFRQRIAELLPSASMQLAFSTGFAVFK